jgi:hypothetical protein
MEDIDPEYFKNLQYIMKKDCTGIGVNFSFDEFKFGKTITRELRPNGANIPVTEENK